MPFYRFPKIHIMFIIYVTACFNEDLDCKIVLLLVVHASRAFDSIIMHGFLWTKFVEMIRIPILLVFGYVIRGMEHAYLNRFDLMV